MHIGFLTKCVGINRGDTPRVPKAARVVPEVNPDTQGQENPISLSMDKSIVNILPVWSITPRDVLSIQVSIGVILEGGE